MGYIVAYLLLAVVVDLLLEMIRIEDGKEIAWVHRRLWNDTHFDCKSKVFSVETAAFLHSTSQFIIHPPKSKKREQSWLVNPWQNK